MLKKITRLNTQEMVEIMAILKYQDVLSIFIWQIFLF